MKHPRALSMARLRAAPGKIKLPDAYANFVGIRVGIRSVPAAGGQPERNKSGDKRNTDDHPVLEVVAQNRKMLDQKMQRPRAPICRTQ